MFLWKLYDGVVKLALLENLIGIYLKHRFQLVCGETERSFRAIVRQGIATYTLEEEYLNTMAGFEMLRSAWLTGPELIPELQLGDLIEFNRENVYSHWAIVVQRENHTAYVVHLTGGNDDFGELGFPMTRSRTNSLTRSNTIADLRSKVVGSATGGCAEVKSDEFLTVARDSLCRVNNGQDASIEPLPPNIVVDRAITQLGRRKYNILFSNCEHFVRWCRYGSKRSDQASRAKSILIGVTALSVTGSFTAGALACALGYGACRVGNHLRHKLTQRYDLLW